MKRILAGLLAALLASPASSAVVQITVKDAAGTSRNFNVTTNTDITGNLDGNMVLCDQAAGTTCASVGTAGAPSTNALTIQAVTLGHGTAANAMRVELPTDGTGVIGTITSITNANITDGSDVTQGAKADAVCASATANACSEIAMLKFIANASLGALATQSSNNSIGGTGILATTTGGATPTFAIAPATPAGVNLKASAGTVYSVELWNIQTTPAYLKLYDSASAPTCGAGTPVKVLPIPVSSTAANGAGSNVTISVGAKFANGIGYCVTGALPNADTTALTANNVLVNIDWN
jgi:hypothetical protein